MPDIESSGKKARKRCRVGPGRSAGQTAKKTAKNSLNRHQRGPSEGTLDTETPERASKNPVWFSEGS